MASLSELVSAADYLQRGKLAADPLYSATSAFATGLTGGADVSGTKGLKKLELTGKLLEIKGKIDEMKQKAEMQKAAKAALQAAGYLPLDPEDTAVARGVANKSLGTEGIDPAAGTKTDVGKLNVLVNNAAGKSGVELDPAATINALSTGKGGVHLRNKADNPGDRMRVRQLAEKMAKSAYAAKVKKQGTGDQFGLDDSDTMIRNYVPTPDDIARFEGEAHKYLYGKAPDAPDATLDAALPKKKKTDELDKVGDLGDVSSLWDLLK